jgi:hypothetical protein
MTNPRNGNATEGTLADVLAALGGGTSEAAAAAPADALTNAAAVAAFVQALALVFNGTTWDRIRGGVTTVDATFIGMANTLPRGVYHSSPTTRTNGQGGILETDAFGNLRSAEQFVTGWNSAYIVTATTTVVKSGAGVLHAIAFGTRVATGVVTVYDNTAASGTVLYTSTAGAAVATVPLSSGPLDIAFATGCTIVTSQAEAITAAYL